MTDNKNMKEKFQLSLMGSFSEFEEEYSTKSQLILITENFGEIYIYTKNGLLDEVNSFQESDISKKLKKALLQGPTDEVPINRNWLSDWSITQVHLLQVFVLLFYSQILIHSQQRILLQC